MAEYRSILGTPPQATLLLKPWDTALTEEARARLLSLVRVARAAEHPPPPVVRAPLGLPVSAPDNPGTPAAQGGSSGAGVGPGGSSDGPETAQAQPRTHQPDPAQRQADAADPPLPTPSPAPAPVPTLRRRGGVAFEVTDMLVCELACTWRGRDQVATRWLLETAMEVADLEPETLPLVLDAVARQWQGTLASMAAYVEEENARARRQHFAGNALSRSVNTAAVEVLVAASARHAVFNTTTVSLLRQLYMADLVSITQLGSWGPFFARIPGSSRLAHPMDAPLAYHTGLIYLGRRWGQERLHPTPTPAGRLREPRVVWACYSKCSTPECSACDTAAKPHTERCPRCGWGHWCGKACRSLDTGHSQACGRTPAFIRDPAVALFHGVVQEDPYAPQPPPSPPPLPSPSPSPSPSTASPPPAARPEVPEAEWRCAGCGAEPAGNTQRPEVKMRTCALCKAVRYCTIGCQTFHWEIGGHADECKSLRS